MKSLAKINKRNLLGSDKVKSIKQLIYSVFRFFKICFDKRYLISPTWQYRNIRLLFAANKNQIFVANVAPINCQMNIDPSKFTKYLYLYGNYEEYVVKFLNNYLKSGMVCCDIGANVGYFTLLMAKLVGNEGLVYSFEPSAETHNSLIFNKNLNGYSNIIVERYAVGDSSGEVIFHEGPPGFEPYNSIGIVNHPAAVNQVFETTSVDMITLDNYLEKICARHVDLIKIDIEGAELLALKGMRNILNINPSPILIIEFADVTTRGLGYDAKEIGEYLINNDFALYDINKNGELVGFKKRTKYGGEMIVAMKKGEINS